MYVHLENCLELYQIIFTNSNITAYGKLRVNYNLLHLYRPGQEQNRAQLGQIIYKVVFLKMIFLIEKCFLEIFRLL